MDDDLLERLVVSFESIAASLKDLHEEAKRAGSRYWPGPREQRDAIISRVETDEERELKAQGARRRNISDIIDPSIEEEPEENYDIIGDRTRQWYRDHPKEAKGRNAGAEDAVQGESAGSSTEEAEG